MGKIFILKGADFSAHKVGDVDIDSPIPDEPIVREEMTIEDFSEYLLTGQTAYFNDQNVWEQGANPNIVCVIIPIDGHSQVVISGETATSVGSYALGGSTWKMSVNAFLKEGRVGSEVVGSRIDVKASDGDKSIDIPDGAKYLWCHVGVDKSGSISPSFLTKKVQLIP